MVGKGKGHRACTICFSRQNNVASVCEDNHVNSLQNMTIQVPSSLCAGSHTCIAPLVVMPSAPILTLGFHSLLSPVLSLGVLFVSTCGHGSGVLLSLTFDWPLMPFHTQLDSRAPGGQQCICCSVVDVACYQLKVGISHILVQSGTVCTQTMLSVIRKAVCVVKY